MYIAHIINSPSIYNANENDKMIYTVSKNAQERILEIEKK